MTALMCLAYKERAFHQLPDYAVVADETHFEYVYADGKRPALKELERVRMEQGQHFGADNPTRWMQIATSNLTQTRFTGSTSLQTFEEAVDRARRSLSVPGAPTTQEQSQ